MNLLLRSSCARSVGIPRRFRSLDVGSILSTSIGFRYSSTTPIRSENVRRRSFSQAEERDFGQLVYRGPQRIVRTILPFKLASYTSSFVCLVGMPYVMITNSFDLTLIVGVSTVLIPVGLCTGILCHWLTKRFVLAAYFDEKKKIYTAIVFNLFGMRRAITFSAKDMRPPLNHAMFCSVFVGKIPLLLFRDSYLSRDFQETVANVEDYGMESQASNTDADDSDDEGVVDEKLKQNTVERSRQKIKQ